MTSDYLQRPLRSEADANRERLLRRKLALCQCLAGHVAMPQDLRHAFGETAQAIQAELERRGLTC